MAVIATLADLRPARPCRQPEDHPQRRQHGWPIRFVVTLRMERFARPGATRPSAIRRGREGREDGSLCMGGSLPEGPPQPERARKFRSSIFVSN